MTRYTSSVSPKGQITIPAPIREEFGIDTRDRVVIEVIEGVITVQPVMTALRRLYRSVPALDPPLDWKEAERLAWEEAALNAAAEGIYPAADTE